MRRGKRLTEKGRIKNWDPPSPSRLRAWSGWVYISIGHSPQKRISICTSVGVRLAPFERERLQRLVRRVGGRTFRGKHVIDPLSLYSIFRLRYTECSGRRMTNRNINPAAPGTKAAWRRRIPILNYSFFRQPFPPSHWKSVG